MRTRAGFRRRCGAARPLAARARGRSSRIAPRPVSSRSVPFAAARAAATAPPHHHWPRRRPARSCRGRATSGSSPALRWPAWARIAPGRPGQRASASTARVSRRQRRDRRRRRARARADVTLQSAHGTTRGLATKATRCTSAGRHHAAGQRASPGCSTRCRRLNSSRRGRNGSPRARYVVDRPAYRWRGIHLDVARHFFAVPVVERYIDLAARYKLNTFHWHLTDDQAWRLPQPPLSGARRRRRALLRGRRARGRRLRGAPLRHRGARDRPAGARRCRAARVPEPRRCGRGTLCTSGAGLAFARDVLGEALRTFPRPTCTRAATRFRRRARPRSRGSPAQLERYLAARGRRLVGWDEIFTRSSRRARS